MSASRSTWYTEQPAYITRKGLCQRPHMQIKVCVCVDLGIIPLVVILAVPLLGHWRSAPRLASVEIVAWLPRLGQGLL